MTTILSKRHPLKFYLTVTLGPLSFLAIATIMLFSYDNASTNGHLQPKEKLMPIFSIGCCALAVYTVCRYFKNAPLVALDNEFVAFNGETYSLADIEKIELTGKRPFKYVVDFPMEAATLTFKNGSKKYIFDDMYSNTWEIKSFLKQVVIDKKNFTVSDNSKFDVASAQSNLYETFRGNQFTSLRGILLWGTIGIFAYALINSKGPNVVGALVFALSFSVLWFSIFSYQMHFFQVSDNYLLIRNHNFFWIKKIYNVSHIREVVFETHSKAPNCLRVITKDFRNKLYPAGTLRDKTWLSLKDKLESYDIKVRNECI